MSVPQPGARPSLVQLARYQTGELSGAELAWVEAWLLENEEGRAYVEELRRAQAERSPLDAMTLRAREEEDRGSNSTFLLLMSIPVMVMILSLAVYLLFPIGPSEEVTDEPSVQMRGEAQLETYFLEDEYLVPYQGAALGEGDILGFQVAPANQRSVVLVSVDGAGTISVFYPEGGDEPFAIPSSYELAPLPGSVELDDAPGPEVFVAIFGVDVPTASQAVHTAWINGEADGIMAWASHTAWADAELVARR
ncbi:MAG: hypothetical protein JXX28_10345 [Deltaproteobacteria bacterium]|nr:hypothetical protein [Deltaproteobacteria bacterium]